MPERTAPQYRYRGSVRPTEQVKRPVAAHRAAANTGGAGSAGSAGAATIDIFDVIDSFGGWWGVSAGDVDAALALVGDVDTLYVRLNSPGGEALEGVAIGNLLRAHAATVRITVYGLAASAASAIAMAGDVVNMAPGSMMMVHDAWNLVIGNPEELRAEAAVLDKLSNGYAALYAQRAGGTTAQWRALMSAETWYTADEAVAVKLADAVAVDPAPSVTPATDPDAPDPFDDEFGYARAAARFDLGVFRRAPAARATQTPADQPVTPPTDHKEADTMSDTISKAGLVKALSLPADADEDAILDAIDERSKTAANAATDTELAVVKRELETTQAQLRGLTEARQRDEDNAKAAEKARVFAEAFTRGAVHPADHAERVQDEADYDAAPEVMARVLAGRADGSRFPVKPQGYGTDTSTAEAKDDGWFPQFNGTKPRVEA